MANGGDPAAMQFATHVHGYLQAQITLADAKAAVLAGISGGLFVAYREITGTWRLITSPTAPDVLRGICAVLFVLFFAMAVLHAYAALTPRMPDQYRRSARWLERLHLAIERFARSAGGSIDLIGGGGLVRWPVIADRARFPTAADYAATVVASSPTDLTNTLAEHSAILARIVAEKYQHVRLSMNYTLAAGILVVVLTFVSDVGR